MGMRIQKYLSQTGVCSRREAEEFIRRGLVMMNGKVVKEMGVQIDPEKDKVEVKGAAMKEQEEKMTVIVNKPRDIASSRERAEGQTIFDLLPQFSQLNIVGRLDKMSTGLLLLSNDGAIARRVTGDEHLTEKEYEVSVREHTSPGMLKAFEEGVTLEDGPTLPAKVTFLDNYSFRIILKEGRKHQIRRMCQYLHLTVTKLMRLRIGPIALGGLRPGKFRVLTKEEVTALKRSSS